MRAQVVMCTTTYNVVDILPSFIEYHRSLGVELFLVADYLSIDGTWELLQGDEWRSFVWPMQIPTLRWADFDASTEMLKRVQRECESRWALFCDTDEFWVTPTMDLRADLAEFEEAGVNFLSVPRYNMTGNIPDAGISDFLQHNIYQIVRPSVRSDEEIARWNLSDPWIFSKVLNKTIVQPSSARSIEIGDHSAEMNAPVQTVPTHSLEVLHYPFRSLDKFREKLERAQVDLDANQEDDSSWHWKRWVREMKEGRIEGEYGEQFLSFETINQLLNNGTITVNLRVATQLARLRRETGRTQ